MPPAYARSVTRIARGLLVGGVLLHAFGPGVAVAQAPPYPASAGFVASDSPDRWNAIGGGNAVAIALGGTVTFDVATGEPHDASFEPSSGAACSVAGGQFTTRIPPAPAAAWSGNCTFSQPGYHAFVCTVHRDMTGEVAVAGADGALTPRTSATPPPTPPPAAPTSPPADAAALRPVFRLDGRQRGAVVRGSIANAGPAATATIDISARRRDLSSARRPPAGSIRLIRLTRRSSAAGRLTFAAALNPAARRALTRRGRLSITLRVTVRGARIAGGRAVRTRVVSLVV